MKFGYDELYELQRETASSEAGDPAAMIRWMQDNGFDPQGVTRMAHENAQATHALIHMTRIEADLGLAALWCAAFELGVLAERRRRES